MSDEHYRTLSAVVLLLVRTVDEKPCVLLQRRKNTGFADGLWDFSASGHVEKNERMTDAVIRECREELDVCVRREDLHFLGLLHKRDIPCDLIYYEGFFLCTQFEGQPTIAEPNKCSQLLWCPLENLPPDMIDDRAASWQTFQKGEHFLEFGW